MDCERQQLINQVEAYLEDFNKSPSKFTSTVRGQLELRTEQIRVLLAALCSYQAADVEKMQLRDELLSVFFKP